MEGGRRRIRPCLETLEARDCPSVTAGVNAGNLIVKATTATSNLAVIQTAGNSFQINLNGQTLGAFSGVTGNLQLDLSNKDNIGVLINLGGFASLKSVMASLGAGVDGLTIENGGIQGPLTVVGGAGVDQVTLGGDGNPLTVSGNTDVRLGTSTGDTLTLNSGVSIARNLTVDAADNVNMLAGSLVGGNLALSSRSGGWILLDGQVGQDAVFIGSPSADNFTLGATGSIGHDLTIRSQSGLDNIAVHGNVGHNLIVNSGNWGGGKTVQVDGQIGRDATVILGHGDNSVDLNGAVNHNVLVNTGAGADLVNVEGSASAKNITVNLGGGDDTLMWNSGASVSGIARLRGDGNSTMEPGDTFVTDLSILPANLRLSYFETKDLGA